MNYWTQPPTAEQIAAVRGRFFVKPERPLPDPAKRPLRALSAAEQAKVAENRAAVHRHLPELVPFVKELHESGLIDGWRGVISVEIFEEGKHEAA